MSLDASTRQRQLNLRIQLLSAALRSEAGMTDRARRLSKRLQELIRERNALRTEDDMQRIEQQRGIA